MNLKCVISALAVSLVLSACGKAPSSGDAMKGASDFPEDQWSKKGWAVQHADGPGAPVLEKPGAKNEFRLKPKGEAGKVIYYEVQVQGNDMPDEWKGAILFPRGTAAPDTWSAAKLEPWDPTLTGAAMDAQAATFKSSIDSYYENQVNTSTQRVEGDVFVGGVAEALTLLIVPDAINDGTELLIVRLNDTRPSGVQDGSGHGVPR